MQYTILIIDDDETTHDVLGEYLKLSGYMVLDAYNGLEGLALLREKSPDLALLDVQMPEMDGFQLLEQARRDLQLADIPILMLTSLDRYNLKVKGLEMGADDYIIKPFNRAEILARVKAALRRCHRFSRASSAMGGDLSAISLAELLQTMELGRRTCTISLPDVSARIYMDAGAVVRIEQGIFSGQSAMQRIMFLERGRFEVTLNDLPPDLKAEPLGVNSLLLDALTCLDELRREAGSLSGYLCMVEEVDENADAALHKLDGMLPLLARDFLCLLEGDLKQNGEALVRSVTDGSIRVSNGTIFSE